MTIHPLPSDVRRALEAVRTGDKHQYGPGVRTGWREHAQVLAAALANAKAEALREAANYFDSGVGMVDLDNTLHAHGTPWSDASVQAAHESSGAIMDWLRARADEIERDAR